MCVIYDAGSQDLIKCQLQHLCFWYIVFLSSFWGDYSWVDKQTQQKSTAHQLGTQKAFPCHPVISSRLLESLKMNLQSSVHLNPSPLGLGGQWYVDCWCDDVLPLCVAIMLCWHSFATAFYPWTFAARFTGADNAPYRCFQANYMLILLRASWPMTQVTAPIGSAPSGDLWLPEGRQESDVCLGCDHLRRLQSDENLIGLKKIFLFLRAVKKCWAKSIPVFFFYSMFFLSHFIQT